MCSTGLTLHKPDTAENQSTAHSTVHVPSAYATSDFDPSNESLWAYFSQPHRASFPTSMQKHSNPQQGFQHHWEIPHSLFHWHHKHGHRGYNIPDVDIRETKTAFYFDIELPGVGDKKSISITWTSSRSFLVEGLIGRLEVEGNKTAEGQQHYAEGIDNTGILQEPSGNHASVNGHKKHNESGVPPFVSYTNGVTIEKKPPQETNLEPWHDIVTVNERRIGAYRRSFDVPCDVENKELRAKLQDGLLSISVPKSEHEHGLDWKPDIE